MSYILLVEDDTHIKNFIIKGLQEAGHTVEHADNAVDASSKIDVLDIDIAIVDIMLKGRITGLDIIKTWRMQNIDIPIIILSARDRVADKIEGLSNGADDYLTKPFSFAELKVRIENLLRRTGKRGESNEYQYKDLSVDVLRRKVTRNGKDISLQRREYMLLEYFLEHPEQVLGKMMILERIWGFDFDPQTNVVDVLISRLRAKIDKDFDTSLIQTVRGMGYVLKEA